MSRLGQLAVLVWELFKISLFVIGGGYVIIAVADGVFARRGWTKEGELLEHLPVFQMVPGLIATHTAVYVGRKVAGRLGACLGVAAVALPSVVIFTLVSAGYQTLPLDQPLLASAFVGLRSALTGIIAALVLKSWTRTLSDAFAYAILLASLAALLLGVPVWAALLGAMLAGLLRTSLPAPSAARCRLSLLPLLIFLKYGALCFGGGFVLVPMYLEDFVGPAAPYLQLDEGTFADLMGLTQMTPGPIGVNGATFFGYRLAGVAGALLASACLLLPGSLLAYFAFASLDRFRENRLVRGLLAGARPASLALMLVAFLALARMSIWSGHLNLLACLFVLTSLVLTMKKKLNPILLVIFTALAAGVLRADDITTARFPDADVVTIDDIERVRYQPSGTYVSENETWTKILTEKGRREESVIQLDFNARYGRAEILSVGRIEADGVEKEIDVSATTKETTDNSAMSANIYDPLDRKLVVTVPGLKVGDVLHVKTRRTAEKPRCENVWADIAILEWTHPILHATYEVTSPADRPLRAQAVRHPLGNVVTASRVLDDGSVVHTFTVTNSPQAFPEPDMPTLYTQVQNVRVSTAANWPEISSWYWNLCAPHMAKTNATMAACVAKLVSDAEDPVRAIFKFVSQEIRYMGLTMEDTSPGYAPHDVDITFANRYGVCRDKAGLLVALLRLAGFEAYPVLIHAGAKLDPEVPQPYFNHAIVAIAKGRHDYQLMDPTNENTKDLFPAYLCDKSYLVARPDGEELRLSPVVPPAENALTIDSRATLAKDGSLVLENDIAMTGINDNAYRGALARRTNEERVQLFERILRSLTPGAELLRCQIEPTDMLDTEHPVHIRLTSRHPEVVLPGRTRDELALPLLSRVVGLANFAFSDNTALIRRRFPLQMDTTSRVSETLEVDLGDWLGAPLALPEQLHVEGGFGYDYALSVTGQTLRATRDFAVNAVEFSPDAYADLRERLKEVEAAARRNPAFARDPEKNADIAVDFLAEETSLASDRSWVTTNTVVKRVLTYDGKKRAAELKFSYNPTWEHVEVISATVSNRDGRVSVVTPKEMNVMDASWAASAPRYPATRLLIVNLPAVEIGSTISCTTVTTVSNAPAAFYDEYCFDSSAPLARYRVRVNDWVREVTNATRLANEPSQPPAWRWCDVVTISSNRFETVDFALSAVSFPEAGTTIREIRDWMTKYIKRTGPGLYELPLADQLTPPETVLKERYATRLDYIRTLIAVLRGAGFEADLVLAADNGSAPADARARIRTTYPNLRAFSTPLARVTMREGGFLGFGGSVRTYFIGTENEYADLGPTAYDQSDFFDPSTGEFGVVEATPEWTDRTEDESVFTLRDDGAVDIDFIQRLYGSGVSAFRKRFAEILPENRDRFYQSLLGDVAQAATATRELVTDTTSYPALRTFSCYVPDYAVVSDNTLSLEIPRLISSLPSLTGSRRDTPISLGACNPATERVVVRFPKGYVKVEHLPDDLTISDPRNRDAVWLTSRTTHEVVDGALIVTIERRVYPHLSADFSATDFAALREAARLASSQASRQLIVSRP